MGFTTIRKVPHERSWGTAELERRFGIERARAMQERCACSARNFLLFVLIWILHPPKVCAGVYDYG